MGLARFDGVRFVPFTGDTVPELRTAEPVRLSGTEGGTLWIGLADGRLVSLRSGRFREEWVPEAGAGLLSGLVRQSADEILFSLKSRHLLHGRRTAWPVALLELPALDRPELRAVKAQAYRCGLLFHCTNLGMADSPGAVCRYRRRRSAPASPPASSSAEPGSGMGVTSTKAASALAGLSILSRST